MRIVKADDTAARRERGMQYASIHRAQVSVAVSAIHNCMEISVQRDAVPADSKLEIGSVCFSCDFDPAQRARVISLRRQDSRNSFQRAQVSVSERVISLYCRIARTLLIQWSE